MEQLIDHVIDELTDVYHKVLENDPDLFKKGSTPQDHEQQIEAACSWARCQLVNGGEFDEVLQQVDVMLTGGAFHHA